MSNFRRRLMCVQQHGGLPAGYQEVEYIENTGTQYIDTGYIPDYTKDIDIEVISTPSVLNSRYCLLSNYSTSRHLSLELQHNKGRCFYNNGNVDSSIGTMSTTTPNVYLFSYDATNKKYNLTFNNETKTGNMNATETSEASMLAFVDQAKRYYTFNKSIKIHSIKISENGILIRKFVPCYRKSDYKPGLYDTVTKEFYTNQGSGEFLYE